MGDGLSAKPALDSRKHIPLAAIWLCKIVKVRQKRTESHMERPKTRKVRHLRVVGENSDEPRHNTWGNDLQNEGRHVYSYSMVLLGTTGVINKKNKLKYICNDIKGGLKNIYIMILKADKRPVYWKDSETWKQFRRFYKFVGCRDCHYMLF